VTTQNEWPDKWQDILGHIHNCLSKDQRTMIIYNVVSILYADTTDGQLNWDPDVEWHGADACQSISDILDKAGLVPTVRVVCESGEPDATLLAKSVSSLHLGVRCQKCLRRLEIYTIGQLLQYTVSDLLKCKNFGIYSVHEIQRVLHRVNLSLSRDTNLK